MAYSELRIVNMAFSRLGVARIDAADWTTPATPQALDADAVYDEVRDEVLEARDWNFAKIREALVQGPPPVSQWEYSYVLPANFLKVAKDKKSDQKEDPAIYPAVGDYIIETVLAGVGILNGLAMPTNNDTVTIGTKVYTFKTVLTPAEGEVLIGGSLPNALRNLKSAINHKGTPDTDYKCAVAHTQVVAADVTTTTLKVIVKIADTLGTSIATTDTGADLSWGATTLVDDEMKFLLCDYDNSDEDLFLIYIRGEDDPSKYSAHFVSALAWRLANEMSIPRTHNKEIFVWTDQMYENSLVRADGLNASANYLEDELGSDSWESAGR